MTTPETTVEVEAPTTTISIHDLVVMYQVLLAAAARGAIKAEEMSVTGALHDKLKQFLEENKVLPTAAPEAKVE